MRLIDADACPCNGCTNSCTRPGRCKSFNQWLASDPPNPPLTLEELREIALDKLAVWCADTDGIVQGLLFMRENWADSQISPHICLLDEEGNPGIYHVGYMAELGAKFYRRKPEEGTA